jgi:hypothetical protein
MNLERIDTISDSAAQALPAAVSSFFNPVAIFLQITGS